MDFFAQVPLQPGNDVQSWTYLLLQGSAVAILGYHLLWGLPKLLKDQRDAEATNRAGQEAMFVRMLDAFQVQIGKEREVFVLSSKEDKEGFQARDTLMLQELTSLRQSIPKDVSPKLEQMVTELGHQTKVLKEWPSDPNKLCQALEALKRSGIDDSLIEKIKEFAKVMKPEELRILLENAKRKR